MRDLRNILDLDARLRERKEPAVLATVVDVAGSSYRRPGARMLLTRDGGRCGTISGGCLEKDLASKAEWLTKDGPATVEFDTRADEDDPRGGYGMGCNGLVRVLLETLPRQGVDPLGLLRQVVETDVPVALATVYDTSAAGAARVGQHLVVFTDGSSRSEIDHPLLAGAVRRDAMEVLSAGGSHSHRYELQAGPVDVFIERLDPPQPLILFGAGDDAQPVARLASELGWSVTVVDHRPAFATEARFAGAQLLVSSADRALALLRLTERSAVVLMTHSYQQDLTLLPALLRSPARYVGMLGPKHRAQQLLEELERTGQGIDPVDRSRLRNPVGLDLGGTTPEEIALAIVSEIVAMRSGRAGGALTARERPIHDVPQRRVSRLSPEAPRE